MPLPTWLPRLPARARRPIRVLHLSTRLEGGVKVIAEMIEAGLAAHEIEGDHRVLVAPGASPTEVVRASLAAAAAILTGRYDAIFAYQSAAALLMGILGRFARVPVRISHLTALPEGLKPRWVALDRWIGAQGGYTHILANSHATQAAYAGYPEPYRARIALIPHGVSPLPRHPFPLDWRAELALPEGAPLLVATGRLADQKGHETAIRALPRIPDAHLAIAGEGPLRAALIERAEALGVRDRVHLVGDVPRGALHALVSAADAYLFPSIWESFGLAGVEALMAGVPIVASDLAVLREVLDVPDLPEGFVRFHAVGDARALAAEVRVSLYRPVPRAARISAARLALAHHRPERMARLYADLLQAGIDRRTRPAGPVRPWRPAPCRPVSP